MKLSRVIEELGIEVRTTDCDLDCEITGCYVSDILSDVMANANDGQLWVTIHIHPNITAVAQFKALAGIIVVNGREPQPETLAKANEHRIPVLTTQRTAFEIAGRLYAMGLRSS